MIDPILNALASPVRRDAMALLSDGQELCLCDLVRQLGVAQPSMSRHMGTLRNAGLVVDRRDAQWVRYRRSPSLPPAVAAVLAAVLEAHAAGVPAGQGMDAA